MCFRPISRNEVELSPHYLLDDDENDETAESYHCPAAYGKLKNKAKKERTEVQWKPIVSKKIIKESVKNQIRMLLFLSGLAANAGTLRSRALHS